MLSNYKCFVNYSKITIIITSAAAAVLLADSTRTRLPWKPRNRDGSEAVAAEGAKGWARRGTPDAGSRSGSTGEVYDRLGGGAGSSGLKTRARREAQPAANSFKGGVRAHARRRTRQECRGCEQRSRVTVVRGGGRTCGTPERPEPSNMAAAASARSGLPRVRGVQCMAYQFLRQAGWRWRRPGRAAVNVKTPAGLGPAYGALQAPALPGSATGSKAPDAIRTHDQSLTGGPLRR